MDFSIVEAASGQMFDFDDLTPQGVENLSAEAKLFFEICKREIDFAFQPIVDIHNGTVYGYEALLRGHERIGENSIHCLFDRADKLNILHRFDMSLRTMVIEKFAQLPRTHKTKLFYNLDNRILSSPDYFKGGTKALMMEYGLPPSSLCLEISERHELSIKLAEENLAYYRGEAYNTAIDDFGSGYSGLKLLHEHHPDFLKIDRCFIQGIEKDKRKKLLVSTISDMAHVLGIFVIAEGVETEQELMVCKEIGVDLVQGFFVSHPQIDPRSLRNQYDVVTATGRRQGKQGSEDARMIYEQIEYRPPLRIDDSMDTVLEAFRTNKELAFFPVVDEAGAPMGILHERALKEYIYSPFGKELIKNRATGLILRKFITACPVADINASTQSILENFSMSESPEGIILVKEFGYLGFLSAASLLRVINEKNLAQARDCSPLTKLPGNSSIASFVSDSCANVAEASILIYMDLDNFKAFNDAYGFRQGDRAILLFAELMRKYFEGEGHFLGHVGGDDFFIGVQQSDVIPVLKRTEEMLKAFSSDVESFYDAKSRERGYLEGKDRHGIVRQFPIMSCSAALLYLPANRDPQTPTHGELDQAIARLKKEAKATEEHVSIYCF